MMENSTNAAPGTPAYFPSCISRIRDAHPDFPLDPVILQSILLCLVGGGPAVTSDGHFGRKNLILRTKDEDVGMVLNLAWLTLTRIFGVPTNKYKVRTEHARSSRSGNYGVPYDQGHPDDLLRKCFFRGKPTLRSPTLTSKHRDRSKRPGSAHGSRRSPALPSSSPTIAEVSLPSVHVSPAHTREGTADSSHDVLSSPVPARSPASALRMRPKAPRMETEPSKLSTVRPSLDPHAHSAPHPHALPHLTAVIPSALVVSGLEHTTAPAQRGLQEVLQEGRIVLDQHSFGQPNHTWKLSPDFIMIYVCSLDAYESPPILRTLLDRFAMSADITISSAVRQAYAIYHSAMSTPRSSSFQSLTPHSPLSPVYSPESTPVIPSPRLRGSPLNSLRNLAPSLLPVITAHELSYLRSLTGPAPATLRQHMDAGSDSVPDAYTSIHPTLDIYLMDLFAAARHHPLIDGTLLTLRAHRDAEDLVRAFRVICGSSLGSELISAVASTSHGADNARSSEDTATDDLLLSPTDDVHSLDWDKLEEEWLGAEIHMSKKKASSVRSLEVRIQKPSETGAPFDASSENARSRADLLLALPRQPEIWDISEVDVGKVFPRVVSHRMRIRAGPDDEILGSVMFPAAADQAAGVGGRVRGVEEKTVKQVIVSILADV